MMKLRNMVMAVALGMGVMGCSFARWSVYHCDECDDFPLPAQASTNPMMPGTYTGPPPKDMTGSSPPATTAPASGPASAPTLPADPFSSSPPAVPAAPPGS
jgi:hypothetical protein